MGVRAIYQLETPWSSEELAELGYEQTADVMVLTHLKHHPHRLTRYGHDNWTLEPIIFLATVAAPTGVNAFPTVANSGTGYVATEYRYLMTAIDAATGQESLPSASVTATNDLTLKGNSNYVTSSPVAGAERYNFYRLGGGSYGYIGTADIPGLVDDNIAPDYSQSFPNYRNPFVGEYDKPAVVTFWNQRSVFGRTLNKPNGIFASQSGNVFNMNVARPAVASDAVTFAVSGRQVNAVAHLVPLKNLIVLTTDTVFQVDKEFEPAKIDISPESYRGASRTRPIVIDDIIMFCSAKGTSLRTLGYQFEADGYRGNDLTVFAPHFFRDISIKDLGWAEFPLNVVSAVASDGDVRLLTWQQEQQVWGWSKMQTAGAVESCCVVSEGGEDVTYYIVRREVAGGQRRYVEYTASVRWTDVKDAVYVDCAMRYSGEPRATFGGLEHLEGKSLDVLADGAAYQDILVQNGSFTLPHAAGKVVAGLPYESWIRTLPIAQAEVVGEPKAIASVTVQVLKTRGIEVGLGKDLPPGQFEPTSSDDEIQGLIDEVKTRELEPYGEPTRLYSGELEIELGSNDWRTADVVVRQRYPLPMTVTSVTPDFVFDE